MYFSEVVVGCPACCFWKFVGVYSQEIGTGTWRRVKICLLQKIRDALKNSCVTSSQEGVTFLLKLILVVGKKIIYVVLGAKTGKMLMLLE